ncbi:MAG: ATP-binding protein [Elusimicrobiota bacterium]
MKRAGKAIYDYSMIENGDRILVGVSGGKDSLTLLRVFMIKQSTLPVDFEIVAAHVDFGICPQHSMRLDGYFKSLGIKYHIEETMLPKKRNEKLSHCFWCSWNRRKILFTLAGEYNCRKVALGHHLDDIVETYLMNLFFHGEISAMPPKISLFGGELTIIRPLAYIPEKAIREFADSAQLPYKKCICPFFDGSRRKYVEGLIKELEKKCPQIRKNLFRSMKRIQYEYIV